MNKPDPRKRGPDPPPGLIPLGSRRRVGSSRDGINTSGQEFKSIRDIPIARKAELVECVLAAIKSQDWITVEKTITECLAGLRQQSFDRSRYESIALFYVAKIHAKVFARPAIVRQLIRLLNTAGMGLSAANLARKNTTPYVVASALLMAGFAEDTQWPAQFCSLYMEDAFEERLWMEDPECLDFVDNILTFLPQEKSQMLNMSEDGSLARVPSNTTPRYTTPESLTACRSACIESIRRYASTSKDISRNNVIKVFMTTVSLSESRAVGCTLIGNTAVNKCGKFGKSLISCDYKEDWLNNPITMRFAKAYLMKITEECSGNADLSCVDSVLFLKVKPMHQQLYFEALQSIVSNSREYAAYALQKYIQREVIGPAKQPNQKILSIIWEAIKTDRGGELSFILQEMAANEEQKMQTRQLLNKLVKALGTQLDLVELANGLTRDQPAMRSADVRRQTDWVKELCDIICWLQILALEQAASVSAKLVTGTFQVADIHRVSFVWLHSIVAKYSIPPEVYLQLMRKILFLDPITSYWKPHLQNPTEADQKIYTTISRYSPLLETTITRLVLIALDESLPLKPVDALEFLQTMVLRGATAQTYLNSIGNTKNTLEVKNPQLTEAILKLCVYKPQIIGEPEPESSNRFAVIRRLWNANILLLVIAAQNNATIGTYVWRELPLVRELMEMVITEMYSFPTMGIPLSEAESAQYSEIRTAEVNSILAMEQKLASALAAQKNETPPTITAENSNLLPELMLFAIKGPPRAPPPMFLQMVQQLNEEFKLGLKLSSCREPDFLLATMQKQGHVNSMKWLVPLVERDESIIQNLPIVCLCEILMQYCEASSFANLRVVENLLKRISELLKTSEDNKSKAPEIILALTSRLANTNPTRVKRALSLIPRAIEEENIRISETEQLECINFEWISCALSVPNMDVELLSKHLSDGLYSEPDPATFANYLTFLLSHATFEQLQETAILIANLLLEPGFIPSIMFNSDIAISSVEQLIVRLMDRSSSIAQKNSSLVDALCELSVKLLSVCLHHKFTVLEPMARTLFSETNAILLSKNAKALAKCNIPEVAARAIEAVEDIEQLIALLTDSPLPITSASIIMRKLLSSREHPALLQLSQAKKTNLLEKAEIFQVLGCDVADEFSEYLKSKLEVEHLVDEEMIDVARQKETSSTLVQRVQDLTPINASDIFSMMANSARLPATLQLLLSKTLLHPLPRSLLDPSQFNKLLDLWDSIFHSALSHPEHSAIVLALLILFRDHLGSSQFEPISTRLKSNTEAQFDSKLRYFLWVIPDIVLKEKLQSSDTPNEISRIISTLHFPESNSPEQAQKYILSLSESVQQHPNASDLALPETLSCLIHKSIRRELPILDWIFRLMLNPESENRLVGILQDKLLQIGITDAESIGATLKSFADTGKKSLKLKSPFVRWLLSLILYESSWSAKRKLIHDLIHSKNVWMKVVDPTTVLDTLKTVLTSVNLDTIPEDERCQVLDNNFVRGILSYLLEESVDVAAWMPFFELVINNTSKRNLAIDTALRTLETTATEADPSNIKILQSIAYLYVSICVTWDRPLGGAVGTDFREAIENQIVLTQPEKILSDRSVHVIHNLVKILMHKQLGGASLAALLHLAATHRSVILAHITTISALLRGRTHTSTAQFFDRGFDVLFERVFAIFNALRPDIFNCSSQIAEICSHACFALSALRDRSEKCVRLLCEVVEFLSSLANHDPSLVKGNSHIFRDLLEQTAHDAQLFQLLDLSMGSGFCPIPSQSIYQLGIANDMRRLLVDVHMQQSLQDAGEAAHRLELLSLQQPAILLQFLADIMDGMESEEKDVRDAAYRIIIRSLHKWSHDAPRISSQWIGLLDSSDPFIRADAIINAPDIFPYCGKFRLTALMKLYDLRPYSIHSIVQILSSLHIIDGTVAKGRDT